MHAQPPIRNTTACSAELSAEVGKLVVQADDHGHRQASDAEDQRRLAEETAETDGVVT